MATEYEDLVAVGLDFNEMLEWTFTRGTCLKERIEKEAFAKLKNRDLLGHYENPDIRILGIECDTGDIEVVFSIRECAE